MYIYIYICICTIPADRKQSKVKTYFSDGRKKGQKQKHEKLHRNNHKLKLTSEIVLKNRKVRPTGEERWAWRERWRVWVEVDGGTGGGVGGGGGWVCS